MKHFNAYTTVSTVLLALSLTACGAPSSYIEETCSEEVCTESGINAPLDEQPAEPTEEEFVDDVIGEVINEPELPKEVIEEEAPAFVGYSWPTYSSSWGLPERMFNDAKNFYYSNYNSIANKRYVSIIDFSKHSSQKRWFLIDLSTGKIEKYLTSHGLNSDKDNDGYATQFSNTSGSKQSSLGFYYTNVTYYGSNGYSMRLQGLESTNSRAMSRAIVVHPANYVREASNYAGRSWGCPALDPKYSASVINRIKNGSLMLIAR